MACWGEINIFEATLIENLFLKSISEKPVLKYVKILMHHLRAICLHFPQILAIVALNMLST